MNLLLRSKLQNNHVSATILRVWVNQSFLETKPDKDERKIKLGLFITQIIPVNVPIKFPLDPLLPSFRTTQSSPASAHNPSTAILVSPHHLPSTPTVTIPPLIYSFFNICLSYITYQSYHFHLPFFVVCNVPLLLANSEPYNLTLGLLLLYKISPSAAKL